MYDIIVVGGGHAGIEAALIAAKLNKKTALVTGDLSRVGFMSCNPSIGGPAKGIVVREIDALGGAMGKVADLTQIQMKMLNRSKGPAVWALRAQIDKLEYPKEMLKLLQKQANLTLIEALVDNLIIEEKKVLGVKLNSKEELFAKAVIITTGTYLASKVLIGKEAISEAADKQPTTFGISADLKNNGFKLIRLKTGTPARVKKSSIDFSKTSPEAGDQEFQTFSFDSPITSLGQQELCYLTHTTPETHQIILNNLENSAMYSGAVLGTGPRYCPSIEDKLVRFNTKPRHQIFLEPETLSNDEYYLQGLSTSLPKDIQVQMNHSIHGLENAQIVRYAYAIEYDAIDPTQLKQSLETTLVENLYCAGQINGTSGYEEAAGQGIMAGINASLKIDKKPPFILKRNEAYIGVLIDDLVSKGTEEPYRLLTSRAEYRLLLRHDNADLRLRDYGFQLGTIDEETYQKFLSKKQAIDKLLKMVEEIYLYPNKETNELLLNNGFPQITQKHSLFDLLKRPDINYNIIKLLIKEKHSAEVLQSVEINVKYDGYIKRALKDAEKMISVDNKIIPLNIDYDAITNIAFEAKEKLKQHRPKTLGQAARLSGVNPTDISVLLIYLQTLK